MEEKTCLDCGFLTIQNKEISHPQRIMIGTEGKSASMPSNYEQTRCFKDLWEYDLHYIGNSFDGVIDEIKINRNSCRGFIPYEPGFTPEQHIEIQLENRKEKLQWKVAILGFLGSLLGGIIVTIISKFFF